MRMVFPQTGGQRGGAVAAALPFLLVVVVGAYAGFQMPPAEDDDDPAPVRIAVDVALVVLHATVTGAHGAVVADLSEQDFSVLEDGVPQRVRFFQNEDIPVTVGLVIDHSTTMGRKLAEVSAAARTFVKFSNPDDELFVINFNETVSAGLPAAIRFTNSAEELEAAITRAPPGGQTALYDAIAAGIGQLQGGGRDKKVLIVISDGGDNASHRDLDEVMKLAQRSSAVIYTVGIFAPNDPDSNPGALERLARASGGQSYLPEQLSEIETICASIARDIRHQYTLGYTPINPPTDGSYRKIRVVARRPGQGALHVRTRTGYIAGGAPSKKGGGTQ
jgi:Ca-activated chloride channel homolog